MFHPLMAAGREIRAVARAETETHRHLRERIVGVTAVTVVVNLVCGVLAYLFERQRAGVGHQEHRHRAVLQLDPAA